MKIRKAIDSDEAAVVEIMNQAISDAKNAYLELFDEDSGNAWFASLLERGIVVLVATIDDVVCGWGSITHYREGRGALAKNAEITFYVHDQYKRRGVATLLVKHLEKCAIEVSKTQVVAILLDDNLESKSLLIKMGYAVHGVFPNIVHFHDKTCGHLYMWKTLVLNQEID